jgi:hypothetical protein
MFLDMLKPNNTDFQDAVHLTLGSKSNRLKAVITALEQCQAKPTRDVLEGLLDAMDSWRTKEVREYAASAWKKGVFYRLWMETKQMLKNVYDLEPYWNQDDPPIPPFCPGSTTLGVYVPERQGLMEICHGFAYRWLVAAGKLRETVSTDAGVYPFNGPNSLFLYPGGVAGYPAARVGGVVQLQAGDLVGMFIGINLGHSLIAVSATQWFAANNAGTFGTSTGRTMVDFNQGFPNGAGWVGNGNQFQRVDHVTADVIYRRL